MGEGREIGISFILVHLPEILTTKQYKRHFNGGSSLLAPPNQPSGLLDSLRKDWSGDSSSAAGSGAPLLLFLESEGEKRHRLRLSIYQIPI